MHGVHGSSKTRKRTAQILLVEDNPADIRLTQEILSEGSVNFELTIAKDGLEAISALRGEPPFADAPHPDLVLLDLNLPRMNGRQVLETAKQDPALRSIPIIILTTSKAESDINACYDLHANCYLTKPVDLDEFENMLKAIEAFWFGLAQLPPRAADGL